MKSQDEPYGCGLFPGFPERQNPFGFQVFLETTGAREQGLRWICQESPRALLTPVGDDGKNVMNESSFSVMTPPPLGRSPQPWGLDRLEKSGKIRKAHLNYNGMFVGAQDRICEPRPFGERSTQHF